MFPWCQFTKSPKRWRASNFPDLWYKMSHMYVNTSYYSRVKQAMFYPNICFVTIARSFLPCFYDAWIGEHSNVYILLEQCCKSIHLSIHLVTGACTHFLGYSPYRECLSGLSIHQAFISCWDYPSNLISWMNDSITFYKICLRHCYWCLLQYNAFEYQIKQM